jgi:hypothetical protein
MPYESNIPGSELRVVILELPGGDDAAAMATMGALMPTVAQALTQMKPGEVRRVRP